MGATPAINYGLGDCTKALRRLRPRRAALRTGAYQLRCLANLQIFFIGCKFDMQKYINSDDINWKRTLRLISRQRIPSPTWFLPECAHVSGFARSINTTFLPASIFEYTPI